ncbi:MAG: hypothetical protein ACK2T6_09090, partial [Anaerolineae bacterium]
PAFRLVNTCKQGRYRIEKEVLTDPSRPVLLQRTRFVTLQGAPGGWSSQTVALDPADLDGTVEVYLAVLNRGQRDTSGRTAIAIDDVVLEVCFNAAVASRYVPRAVTAHP